MVASSLDDPALTGQIICPINACNPHDAAFPRTNSLVRCLRWARSQSMFVRNAVTPPIADPLS